MEVSIRQYQPSDVAHFYEAVRESIEHVSEWLAWCGPDYSLAEAEEWTLSAAKVWDAGTDYRFLIEDSDTGQILGSVGINSINHPQKIGSLGYWVRKSALNQRVCTRAARLAAEFAFDTLGLQRIEVYCQVDNEASNAVAAKLGGLYEGIFRNKILFKGQSLPAKCYSIVPTDYADADGQAGLEADLHGDVDGMLRGLELRLLDPAVRADASELDSLLSEDFLEFGSSGRSYDKADILSQLPVSDDVQDASISDFVCLVIGDTAHVTYRLTIGSEDGDTRCSLRSSLWRCCEGSWRLLFHQGTTTAHVSR